MNLCKSLPQKGINVPAIIEHLQKFTPNAHWQKIPWEVCGRIVDGQITDIIDAQLAIRVTNGAGAKQYRDTLKLIGHNAELDPIQKPNRQNPEYLLKVFSLNETLPQVYFTPATDQPFPNLLLETLVESGDDYFEPGLEIGFEVLEQIREVCLIGLTTYENFDKIAVYNAIYSKWAFICRGYS